MQLQYCFHAMVTTTVIATQLIIKSKHKTLVIESPFFPFHMLDLNMLLCLPI